MRLFVLGAALLVLAACTAQNLATSAPALGLQRRRDAHRSVSGVKGVNNKITVNLQGVRSVTDLTVARQPSP